MTTKLTKFASAGDWCDFYSFPRLFDKVLDDAFGMERWNHTPVDLYETATDLVAEVALPGIPQENWDIEIIDNYLKINTKDKKEDKKEDVTYHRKSWLYSSKEFSTSIKLPADVNSSATKATYKDGILKVIMPKIEKSDTVKIEIKKE